MLRRSRYQKVLDFIEYEATADELYGLRQAIATTHDGFFYGDLGTVHGTGEVNIQQNKDGRVINVWFRCQVLPFTVSQGSLHDIAQSSERIRGIEFE